jgi:hypothetical protein
MATAPFQLWLDLAPVASAVRVSSTVTVTTSSPHAISTGAYIQIDGTLGTAGTSMTGVYSVTVTSGTTFTYTSAGSAGTADLSGAFISYDLMTPLLDYSGASRETALYVPLESLQMAAAGDGAGVSFGFTINQDDTPAEGPWYLLVPDQTRVRLVEKETGQTPATDKSDVRFIGALSNVNAKMSGSGQGSTADVDFDDPNALLERLMVFGGISRARTVAVTGGFVRAANVTTVTTTSVHGFTVGQKIQISGVIGGGGTSFNGIFTIASTPSSRSFTYSNAGPAATGNTFTAISAAAFNPKRLDQVVITSNDHGLYVQRDGLTIVIKGVTSANATAQNYINGTFGRGQFATGGQNSITVRLPAKINKPVPSFAVGSAEMKGNPRILPVGGSSVNSLTIQSGVSEVSAVNQVLTAVSDYKGDDQAVLRLVDTTDTSQIVGSGIQFTKTATTLPTSSLRSALDSLVELFSGLDQKQRRYYIDQAGRLNWRMTDNSAAPTYATAPYKIITTGAGDPNTTTAAATIAPFELSVNWDHDTIKAMVFNVATTSGSRAPVVQNYISAGYADRPGAPEFDDNVDYPTAAKASDVKTIEAAKYYFLDRHKPLLSGRFTLRGSGGESFNANGFSAGYAQTGAATFALVSSWQPGQWVDVTSAELGLSGLYRVEQVDWSLEPGSYNQIITITFNRRLQSDLTSILERSIG